ncbi:hypothetical protein ABMA27_013954 [Loxostege sticticalis]|uniref:AB hydrolase-1 domain-containing protein n=1 Tax=Loxostege sticticalis TaxID=481309 RepID=A0ABR3IC35_LOXSC
MIYLLLKKIKWLFGFLKVRKYTKTLPYILIGRRLLLEYKVTIIQQLLSLCKLITSNFLSLTLHYNFLRLAPKVTFLNETRSTFTRNFSFNKSKPAAILAYIKTHNLHTKTEVPTKEIKIPVQYGHIAAKLWGNDQERPILALHGWQDNAGTWDTLAPMLCQNRSILAFDHPGHGHSSWIPPGMHYYPWEYSRLILFLKNYFKWNKVSLLSHSMGSVTSLRFASVFPYDFDCYISVNSLIANDSVSNLIQTRLNDEPPSYPMEELHKIWHLGTRKSVALESPSTKDPNKYHFSRDLRVKHALPQPPNKKFVEALVRRLKCPTLYIKAIDSPFSSDEFSIEMREVIEKNNPDYEKHFVPGTHYVHLNNPERLAPLIKQFMNKHNLRI